MNNKKNAVKFKFSTETFFYIYLILFLIQNFALTECVLIWQNSIF